MLIMYDTNQMNIDDIYSTIADVGFYKNKISVYINLLKNSNIFVEELFYKLNFIEKVKTLSLIRNEETRRMFMDKELLKTGADKFFIVQSEEDEKLKHFNSIGINTTEKRKDEIIISMTCMPSRFYMLKYALYSLMNQTKKPDKIILTLSTDEIPDQMIPDYILRFEKLGLTFQWTKENLKRDKKLFPLFETVDDN